MHISGCFLSRKTRLENARHSYRRYTMFVSDYDNRNVFFSLQRNERYETTDIHQKSVRKTCNYASLLEWLTDKEVRMCSYPQYMQQLYCNLIYSEK